MRELSLNDFQFNSEDHCYYYEKFILEPTFGGFLVYHDKNLLSEAPLPTKESLILVEEMIEEIRYLTDDDLYFDYKMDKLAEEFEEEYL